MELVARESSCGYFCYSTPPSHISTKLCGRALIMAVSENLLRAKEEKEDLGKEEQAQGMGRDGQASMQKPKLHACVQTCVCVCACMRVCVDMHHSHWTLSVISVL